MVTRSGAALYPRARRRSFAARQQAQIGHRRFEAIEKTHVAMPVTVTQRGRPEAGEDERNPCLEGPATHPKSRLQGFAGEQLNYWPSRVSNAVTRAAGQRLTVRPPV